LALTQNSQLEIEMSPASRAPRILNGHGSQGSQSLAFGLSYIRPDESGLGVFVRSRAPWLWASPFEILAGHTLQSEV